MLIENSSKKEALLTIKLFSAPKPHPYHSVHTLLLQKLLETGYPVQVKTKGDVKCGKIWTKSENVIFLRIFFGWKTSDYVNPKISKIAKKLANVDLDA